MPSRVLKGGEALQARLAELSRGLSKAKKVRVGFLENATYPDTGEPVATVAAIQEFGAPAKNIPPRPFFRSMIAAKSGEWPEGVAGALKAADYDAEKALDVVGEAIGGQLRESITALTSPPLKPATIKRKGFDKPLVDTGHMLASVDHEVVE